MPKTTSPSRGLLLFVLILLLAAGLRFVHLGSAPLSEFEAEGALAARAVAAGQPSGLGAQPGYVLLTSLLFSLLGDSNLLARLWPAVAGLALAALPYAWRRELGHKTALLFCLFLALDPGLVGLARLAGGASLALAALPWAATLLLRGQAVPAGVLAAAALLAGPDSYLGLAAAGLTMALARLKLPPLPWRAALPSFLGVLVLGGTLLFRAPQGLAGIGQGLAAFWFGEGYPAAASVSTALFAVVGYGLPALLLGLPHLLRRQPVPGTRLAAVFAGLVFALTLLQPARQVAYLAWALLPLYWLAAIEVGRYLQAPFEEPRATWGQFLLIALLMPFFAFTLARASRDFLLYFEPGRLLPMIHPNAVLPLVVVLVAGLASLLVGLGWSGRAARQGLVWALALTACLGLLAASAHYARQTSMLAHDLWQPGPAAADLGPLLSSIDDLSFWQASQRHALAVDLRTSSAALRWALRQSAAPGSQQTPALAVTAADQQPAEFAAYRGQSFAWQTQRAWQGWPDNLFAWLLFRHGVQTQDQVILWARSDLFLDGANDIQNLNEANP